MRDILNNTLVWTAFVLAIISSASCQKKDGWEGDPIQLDLPSMIDTTAFRATRVDIPFKVNARNETRASLTTVNNLEAELGYDPSSGTGRLALVLPFGKQDGTVALTVTDGEHSHSKRSIITVRPKARTCSVTGFDGTLPAEGGSVTVTVETNLPAERLEVSGPEWTKLAMAGGILTIDVERNLGFEDRSAYILIDDKEREITCPRIEVTQPWYEKKGEGYVTFPDKALLAGVIEAWDKDGDRALSTEETEAVTEIILPGRGIRDITGIGQLKRLEKIDLRDNMIVDATELRELYYLHWLDLKGNMSLRTFDVTGCCVYFDHCDYELTEDLLYHTNSSQIGVSGSGSPDNFKLFDVYDPNYTPGAPTHSHHVVDDYPTTDWSEHDRMIKIRDRKRQPVVNGVPTDIAFVIIGYGFIDRDIKDGSYERMAREIDRVVYENYGEAWDVVDVYYLTHLYPSRMHYDTPDAEGMEFLKKVEAQAKDLYNTEVMVYNTLYGKDNTGNRCVLFGQVGLHKWVWSNAFANTSIATGKARYIYGLHGPRQDIDYDDPYYAALMMINGQFLDYGFKSADFLRVPINNADPVRHPGNEREYERKIAKIEDCFSNKMSKGYPFPIPPMIEEKLGLRYPDWVYQEWDKYNND